MKNLKMYFFADCKEIIKERLLMPWNLWKLFAENMLENIATIS
jgi:hypothetical protein